MRYKSNEVSALNKIYNATFELIKKQGYDSLTISDIIRESNISRSTFYIYFKSKDQILIHLCNDIFDHVFADSLHKEQYHDYSKQEGDPLHMLEHSFHHFFEDKDFILPILNASSSNIFLSQLRKRLKPLITQLIEQKIIGNNNVPMDMKVHQYVNGYVSMLQYYLRHGNDLSPQQISDYYISLSK